MCPGCTQTQNHFIQETWTSTDLCSCRLLALIPCGYQGMAICKWEFIAPIATEGPSYPNNAFVPSSLSLPYPNPQPRLLWFSYTRIFNSSGSLIWGMSLINRAWSSFFCFVFETVSYFFNLYVLLLEQDPDHKLWGIYYWTETRWSDMPPI
jgi:hypothetical protein